MNTSGIQGLIIQGEKLQLKVPETSLLTYLIGHYNLLVRITT